jgi:hypothetical protein
LPVMPQLEVHLIPGAGHIPHHTHPVDVARWVEEFVMSLDPVVEQVQSPFLGQVAPSFE